MLDTIKAQNEPEQFISVMVRKQSEDDFIIEYLEDKREEHFRSEVEMEDRLSEIRALGNLILVIGY
jgi:hypothetical protein